MARFYLRLALAAALFVATPRPTNGQLVVPEQPILGSAWTADMLRQLPISQNPLALLDTAQNESIGDRFFAGGLNVASAPKAGGLLNSWTQTQFHLGGINITDPRAGGTPLLLPIVPMISAVSVETGAMSTSVDRAQALSMWLGPLEPGRAWERTFDGSFSASGLVGTAGTPEPAVDRVHRWEEGTVAVSGPLNSRVSMAATGSWRGLSHLPAPGTTEENDHLANGFTQFVFKPAGHDIRAIAWVQQARTQAFEDNGLHAQGSWTHSAAWAAPLQILGGYTRRSRTVASTPLLDVDSLTSDPVSDLLNGDAGTTARWTIGARFEPPSSRRYQPSGGVDLEGASVRVDPAGIEQIRERVDGTPARLWTVRTPATIDDRHSTSLSAYADEHIPFGRLTLDAGVRLDHVSASAEAASSGIAWTTWLPRAMAQWQLTQTADVRLIASYRRSAYQLPLNVLAIGDPAAPVADISRWTGQPAPGALIARVGPGTGGDASFTKIDPHLRRPTTDELVLAVRSRPFKGFEIELARVTKREQPLMGLFDTGVDPSSYTAFQVPDPNYVPAIASGFEKPFVTVLNRPAGAYGRDQYLLTNRTDDPEANSWAMELNIRHQSERIVLISGIALTWAKGPAAAVGFLPSENDQNLTGNTFVDANTYTEMRGQLFQDRSHAGKIAGIYRLPHGVSLGAIARYQDGQPFARLVFVPNLNQGPMVVRAYRNGGAAFTYTGTLDVRLQWTVTRGAASITLGADVYNLPNMGKEVAEYVVAGPRFRTPTMLQPPRTAVLGARVRF